MADQLSALTNPLEDRVGYQLRRASVAMMTDLATRLADLNLTIGEASILVLIAANPGTTQTEIGRALGIHRANMVPLTAGLETAGFVQRKPADGRSHALTLTAKGRAMAVKSDSAMRSHEDHFLREVPEGQRRQLLTQLAAIFGEVAKV